MKTTTKAILRLLKATDAEITDAYDLLKTTAKDFIDSKEWVRKYGWVQSTNARFLLHCHDEVFKDLSDVEKAIFALELSNASAMLQWLTKEKLLKAPESLLDECD